MSGEMGANKAVAACLLLAAAPLFSPLCDQPLARRAIHSRKGHLEDPREMGI
jgi:hypothetical protein